MPYEITLPDGYVVSDDKARLDIPKIHRFLSEQSYWAKGRPLDTVAASIAGSSSFGLYAPDGAQAGFARAVSDFATMVHLTDIFVLPAHRGGGHGKALVAAIVSHPSLRNIRRWTLATDDAHGLYAQFGFGAVRNPAAQMMRTVDPDTGGDPSA